MSAWKHMVKVEVEIVAEVKDRSDVRGGGWERDCVGLKKTEKD